MPEAPALRKLLAPIAVALGLSGAVGAQQLPPVLPAPPGNLARREQLGLFCAQLTAATRDVNTFARCTQGQVVLPAAEQTLIQCASISADTNGFAGCVGADMLGRSLNADQQAAIQCAARSNGDIGAFAGCMGNRFLGNQLTPNQNAALECARHSGGDMSFFAMCAGSWIIGPDLSKEQQDAIQCAAESGGDPTGFMTCSANKVLQSQLNSEQQIAVQCVIESGGQPYAAAACTASRLTIRELDKCLSQGFGGNGCFGDTNDIFGRKGWAVRNFTNVLNDIRRGGPGPTNDLFGGQGFSGRTIETIRRNAPPPMQIGTVAGHRVCLPWC